MSDDAGGLGMGDRIELTFPARPDLVVLARLVASAASARAGFDIEELEDLRVAVNELCMLAMQGSDAGALCLVLTMHDDAIGADCTLERAAAAGAPTPEGEEIARLSEQILDALVDEHGREIRDGAVRTWLRKQRREHGA
jgi:serine/threonine-protein kinase RsbW